MTIQQTGPGGVSNSYGVRGTTLPSQYNNSKAKDTFSGFAQESIEKVASRIVGPKKIIGVGDSLIDYGDRFGRNFYDPVTLNFLILKGASLNTPTASGPVSFDWNREAGTLRYAAPGDTFGPTVYVNDGGIFTLTSGNPIYNISVGCKTFTMPSTPSAQETCAYKDTTWIKNLGGFLHMVDVLTYHRFTILRNKAISGISAFEIRGQMMQQAIDSDADIIVENPGTNDIQLRNRTAEQVAADRVALWDQAGSAGKQVIALLLSPRWGNDGTGAAPGNFGIERAKYSAAFQARLVGTNRLLIAAAASRPWVRIADCWQNVVDGSQTDGRVRNGYTKDGLHDSGGLAYERALVIARILNVMYPNDSARVNIGAGSYYDAVNNPGGNLLAGNQGAFAGTNGTVGAVGTTGATMGTGLATSMSLTRRAGSTNILATANKVAATDGGQDWQELVISGGVTADETMLLSMSNIVFSNVAIGDTLEFSYEFQVVGTGCTGVYCDMFMAGLGFQPAAMSIQSIVQGLRDGEKGIISTEPLVVQPGVTSCNPRLYVQSAPGATFSIRYRNADLHKVL